MTISDKVLDRIKTLSAFNITEAVKRKTINQHVRIYWFKDNSTLTINSTAGIANSSTGKGSMLNINTQGD